MNKYDPQYMDQEEKAIIESIKTMDVNKLKKPSINEQKKMRLAAKDFMKKHTKILCCGRCNDHAPAMPVISELINPSTARR